MCELVSKFAITTFSGSPITVLTIKTAKHKVFYLDFYYSNFSKSSTQLLQSFLILKFQFAIIAILLTELKIHI